MTLFGWLTLRIFLNRVITRFKTSTLRHGSKLEYEFTLSGAGRWKTLRGPVVIGGDNLPFPGLNSVNWSAKYWGGQWPPWPLRFRHHCCVCMSMYCWYLVLIYIEVSLVLKPNSSIQFVNKKFFVGITDLGLWSNMYV